MKSKVSLLTAAGKNYVGMSCIGKKYTAALRDGHANRLVSGLLLLVAVSMFSIGRFGTPIPVSVQQTMAAMKFEIQQQQLMLEQLSREQENNVSALAARLAELTAASTRLDALGERLVQLGQLDPEEFDFNLVAPVGGPERVIDDGHSNTRNLNEPISRLMLKMRRQLVQLDALQLLLLDRSLEAERTPAGWPVSSGWISSGFGERNDPFTGKRTRHEGLDFAGIEGSDVLGVASGVVIWAGAKQGFGRTVEIDHGNGFITRYGHNEQLKVRTGDRITAGQVIASMGKTGRASSPHVHFEVLFKDEAVNPYQFVQQVR